MMQQQRQCCNRGGLKKQGSYQKRTQWLACISKIFLLWVCTKLSFVTFIYACIFPAFVTVNFSFTVTLLRHEGLHSSATSAKYLPEAVNAPSAVMSPQWFVNVICCVLQNLHPQPLLWEFTRQLF